MGADHRLRRARIGTQHRFDEPFERWNYRQPIRPALLVTELNGLPDITTVPIVKLRILPQRHACFLLRAGARRAHGDYHGTHSTR